MNESLRVRKPDAMDRLVQQESPLLYGFIFRLVRDPEETQNLVQATFLQAVPGYGLLPGPVQVFDVCEVNTETQL